MDGDDLSTALTPFVATLKPYVVGRVRRPEFAADFDRLYRAEQRSAVDEQRSDHARLILDGFHALVGSKKVDDYTAYCHAGTLLRLAGYADDRDLARRTAAAVPELAAILAEHIDDNDGILAHVYFGDVSRWVCERTARNATAPAVVDLLELLEAAYISGDEIVRNLIGVSFIEMVEDDPAVTRLLGPRLSARVNPDVQRMPQTPLSSGRGRSSRSAGPGPARPPAR